MKKPTSFGLYGELWSAPSGLWRDIEAAAKVSFSQELRLEAEHHVRHYLIIAEATEKGPTSSELRTAARELVSSVEVLQSLGRAASECNSSAELLAYYVRAELENRGIQFGFAADGLWVGEIARSLHTAALRAYNDADHYSGREESPFNGLLRALGITYAKATLRMPSATVDPVNQKPGGRFYHVVRLVNDTLPERHRGPTGKALVARIEETVGRRGSFFSSENRTERISARLVLRQLISDYREKAEKSS